MFNPVHTYRIQFHKGFTFQDFNAIIPYLHQLGVKTIYASPIFQAVPGSRHGYDVVNPYVINPEIGSEDELVRLSKKLKVLGISWIQDIVPNHMAFHPSNIWLMDVLEKGALSVYASFFDVTWTNPLFHGRLMAPFLDGTLHDVISKGELKVTYDHQQFGLTYFDQFYPLHPRSYHTLLQCAGEITIEVQQFIDQLEQLPQITNPVNYALRWRELQLQLAAQKRGDGGRFMEECLTIVNNNIAVLSQIAETQVYRLCSWKETNERINYRRFFTVNGLICLNMQQPEVFSQYHQKVKSLLADGIIQGLRIDHIDGLYDPQQYLHRLRDLAGNDCYIVVEKILEPGEKLPAQWPVQGTTGYDFLALVNNVLTRPDNERKFSRFYAALEQDNRSTHDKIIERKAFILQTQMQGELDNLYHLFVSSDFIDSEQLADIGPATIREAISEFLIQCPVYRYYGNQWPLQEEENQHIKWIFDQCRRRKPWLREVSDLLEVILLQHQSQQSLYLYQRCMQFTGPLMAKGVEDTLMYTFNRFIGHNEVGDSPEFFGLTTEDFHNRMKERQQSGALTMNATSTHDTKRGEDVRTRLNVLSTLPEEWIAMVREWQQLNAGEKINGAPDANDEYFIYQTLVGAFPMREEDDFVARIKEYLVKALREGKRNSDWAAPNERYENATLKFLERILLPDHPFYTSFIAFQKNISDHGIINSLAQVMLKFSCPGVPDSYQGSASWDLSLVDPDNRRPIDFEQRKAWLDALSTNEDNKNPLAGLWEARNDSRIKLWLVHQMMLLRSTHEKIYQEGAYIPLKTTGAYEDNVLAFARRWEHTWIVTVIPLYTASLCNIQQTDITRIDWKDTAVILPPECPTGWRSLLGHGSGTHGGILCIKDISSVLPLAMVKLEEQEHDRKAGILLSVTSLSSPYGIGDLGDGAHDFVVSLSKGKQTYWQLLPLNPVTATDLYSPYSSSSAMAGNILLISPERLIQDGWIDGASTAKWKMTNTGNVDYRSVEENKMKLLEEAWGRYQASSIKPFEHDFQEFMRSEAYWLDDFALYVTLKKQHGTPWPEWPAKIRCRDKATLDSFKVQYEQELRKEKWFQFLFARQWESLRNHCRIYGVRLLGDLPFYVSYDSVDVWSHPDIFSLDEEGKMLGIAGVPPDYFNAEGQWWGMPVYRWDIMQKKNYRWWVDRVKKNLERVDLLRFDHFRAFDQYWEIPASEKTAINGRWKNGPGAMFFEALKTEIGTLPFIAEDLGEITQSVYDLRDQFGFAGMKILQYAFDEQMAQSVFIPHRYTRNAIVYTGTHDNNTTRGWYRTDTDEKQRTRIEKYVGHVVDETTISATLIRTAYSSIARLAIIPMQDLLNLGEEARMNTPSSLENNWRWRLKPGQFTAETEDQLREWVMVYGR